MPIEIRALSLSVGQVVPDARPRAYRADGAGLLRSDGRRWYGVEKRGEHVWFVEIRFEDGKAQKATKLPAAVGESLLLSPSGRHLYAVNYRSQPQTITVIDTATRVVERTARLDRQRTKAPVCAAILSPGGSRLYMVARDGNADDGIDVYDTATFERVAHFVPDRAVYCLAISPDGGQLYASTFAPFNADELDPAAVEPPHLITVDTQTGEEVRSVPLPNGDGWLVVAA